MLTVSFMRYHKPNRMDCVDDVEFCRWCDLYNAQLDRRRKPKGDDKKEWERYEKRKEINSRACKNYYNKRRLLENAKG